MLSGLCPELGNDSSPPVCRKLEVELPATHSQAEPGNEIQTLPGTAAGSSVPWNCHRRRRPRLQSCKFAPDNLNLKRSSGNFDDSAHHSVVVKTQRSAGPHFSRVIGLLFAPAQSPRNSPTSISLIRVCRALGFYLAVHVIPTWRSRHFLSPLTEFALIPTGDKLLSKLRANEKTATDVTPCCGQLCHCDRARCCPEEFTTCPEVACTGIGNENTAPHKRGNHSPVVGC
jgi:hypothetical protein